VSALEKRTDQTTQLATVLTNEQLKFIAGTEFVPKGLRGNLPAILACVATGRAIGIDDMTAIRSIHIIDGKPTFAAELMVMLVRRRGHSIVGEVGPDTATVTGKRADNGDEMRVTWTLEMAKRAGLTGKGNWKSYPEAMLWARAVSQLCRMLFADCFAGATHTPEELDSDETSTEARVTDGFAVSDTEYDGEFPPVDGNGEIIEAGSKPVITDAQRTRLWTIATDANVAEDRLRELVRQYAGVESTKLIPRDCYEPLCEAVMAEVFSPPEETFEERAARAQATRDAAT
jgi:hypothetical protein